MQSQKKNELEIEEDETLLSKKIKIAGIYDPAENGLTIDMWSNSDGKRIIDLLNKIKKKKLSEDAKEILNISILTSSYFPQKNISEDEFLKIKLDWLLQSGDLKLIEKYLIKNQNINKNLELIKFLLDDYLSQSDIEKACSVFDILQEGVSDDYLSKYKIYCLINKNKKEEAQLLFDLKKELGFKDIFFEKKFNFLMGYDSSQNKEISEKNILDFHLSHRTNTEFSFSPNQNTKKIIWKYLSSSNLLEKVDLIDLEDIERIKIIEKATNEGNYTEKDLFNLYKRFQFSIDQLITVEDSYKLLSEYERRALLYQGIIIHNNAERKIQLVKILLDEFKKSKIDNAFNKHLVKILKEINKDEVPSNHVSFYDKKLESSIKVEKDIKFNNKILHQSKLLNYFFKEMKKEKIEKELENILKKLAKDKNYYFTTKDFILIESLINDGIKVPEKYISLLELYTSNIPTDIQVMLNDDESGMILLRLVEIIGEDNFKDLGSETQYFIIATLNKLNSNKLRNELILKILPFKV